MKESRYLFNARFLILYFAVRKATYDMPKMRCISSSSFPMSVRRDTTIAPSVSTFPAIPRGCMYSS